jgi:hypothetical protein
MLEGLPIDPYTVLGVKRDASADDIRDAFHQKSKKHHPDHGGDDWAFRVVVHAYNLITSGAALELSRSLDPKAAQAEENSRIRPGVHDRDMHPSRLVLVEILWMRYAVDDFFALLGDKSKSPQLSGSIKMTWPDPELPGDPRGIPFADRILLALNGAFDELRGKTSPLKARSNIEVGRFEAWLSYPNGKSASMAFKHLHVQLKARGLGVRQWTRELILPHEAGS